MRSSVAIVAAACALSACSYGAPALTPTDAAQALGALRATGAGKIRHIVYIVQENRSFNDLFEGYPGAYTVSSGKDSKGRTVVLRPVSLAWRYEIDHSAKAMFADCDGTGKLPGTKCAMDGFNHEQTYGGPPDIKYPMYVYAPHRETKPYFDMAHEWVLADRMFQSQLDESFVAHQYIIAAQAHSSVDIPYGPWGCVPGPSDWVDTIKRDRTYGPPELPCFDYQTLGD